MIIATAWLFSRRRRMGWWLALACNGLVGFWLGTNSFLRTMQDGHALIALLLSLASVIVCLLSRSTLQYFQIVRTAAPEFTDADQQA
jgi:hypothetical protein